ncbi:MAG TPA: D-alanyl-D-alanine carboxypeptidase, partial [Ruminococcaceae bacterium]|nr:D-alanyl-D-alanine carboxypeptidase [Oscillospiraceae bacterium]
MKRFICLLLCILTLFSTGAVGYCEGELPGGLSAKAEILYEANTGQILWSKNADAKLPIASVTKTMSLLLWAEAIDSGKLTLEEKVRTTAAASGTEGSTIWLNIGEEMTAAELLEAVIVNSANDACVALAEHVSGSEAEFVK